MLMCGTDRMGKLLQRNILHVGFALSCLENKHFASFNKTRSVES